MKEVGAEIRRLRQERGWTGAQLAVYAGMAPSAISQIETGRRSPNAGSLEKISKALEVEVAALFPLGQASLPEFDHGGGFEAWAAALGQYKSLRQQISDFEELRPEARRAVFEDSLQLLQALRVVYNPADLELALLHDVLYQAVLRMVAVYELDQERGDTVADVVEIAEYKALLRPSA